MNVPYIINVGVILIASLLFYKLLLRRETFYKVNRYMLLACLGVAFLLPLWHVPAKFSFRKAAAPELKIETASQHSENRTAGIDDPAQQKPATKESATANGQPENGDRQIIGNDGKEHASIFSFSNLATWLFWIYWFGVAVFGTSFLFQVILLVFRAWRNPVIVDGPYRIIEVAGEKAPCSFANYIFINPEKYDWETYNQILLHEKIHIREKHTLDIILSELVLIFQWFNPFAWIYRREVESNLEFLTDDYLMQKEKVDKQSYQMSLVKVSAPHLPLSLTTNYNQSILKKRIAMMNTKRSNLHTAWKYFFLLPMFVFLASLLNEPGILAQTPNQQSTNSEKAKENSKHHEMRAEGYWFAVIKGEKVNIQFSDEKMESDDYNKNHWNNNETFALRDLGNIPKGSAGTFNITREAGTMQMTGKFEGNTGMGTYKFVADKSYVDYMSKELKETLDEDDQLAFFFINARKENLTMLHGEGYSEITKEDLIPIAALGIDKAYISSIRNAGFSGVSLQKLIPMKALGIDGNYIRDIRSEYSNITADQLVGFKAQGIDKEMISKIREMKSDKGEKGGKDDPDDIISYKALNITPEFIKSFKAIGLSNIPHDQLVGFKAVGVTPEYINSWRKLGFNDIDAEDFIGLKSQNVTPEFMKTFTDMGYKVKPEDLIAFRALGINTDYIKAFQAAGYKVDDLDNLTGLKSQNITPEYIKSFESVGFDHIGLDEIVAVKAVGVTPDFIKDMRSKGFDYDKIQKYVTLKSLK